MQVSSDRQLPKKVFVGQLLALLVIALVWLLTKDGKSALVALLSGVALVIPNGLLAWRIHQLGPGANPRSFMRSIYVAEVLKFLLVALVFAVVTLFFAAYFFPAFSACIGILVMAWVVPFWHVSQTNG